MDSSSRRRRGGPPRWLVTTVVVAVVLAAVAILPSTGLLDSEDDSPPPTEPAKRRSEDGRGSTPVATVTRPTELRARPDDDGRVIARLSTRTEYKSKKVLLVVDSRGGWLRVATPELPNNRYGWVSVDDVKLSETQFAVEIDLSERRLVVRRRGRVVRRATVAVGREAAPSPRGLFAVTDKLRMGGPSDTYGCCAVALTSHQPDIPQGWTGEDRIAIHATPNKWTIGKATTLGCFRAEDDHMRWMMRRLPLGTPVEVMA
jgi:lipoprotein-anchoring transpeptidase ErfK/SrfK